MISMDDYQNTNEGKVSSELLGFGLIKILEPYDTNNFETIFNKGIEFSLIHNLIESIKDEMAIKKQGNCIIPIDDNLISLQYFEEKNKIFISIFKDNKDKRVNYAKTYLIFKKLKKLIQSEASNAMIEEFCQHNIIIPQITNVKALLILSSTGSPFYSRIENLQANVDQSEVHISAFISAIFSFAKKVIGKNAESNLKEIIFDDQRFYIISKSDVIFAFLVENLTLLLKNYMYFIVDEFLNKFNEHLKNFNGDISPFQKFDEIINKYFIF